MTVEVIIFAKVFTKGKWTAFERTCLEEEAEGVIDSAQAKAAERGHTGEPLPIDFLGGAHYIFNVARGTHERPKEGDTTVYAVSINQIVIGYLAEFRSERLIA